MKRVMLSLHRIFVWQIKQKIGTSEMFSLVVQGYLKDMIIAVRIKTQFSNSHLASLGGLTR